MGERDDLVYQAKLAEQAERYDGKPHFEAASEWGHVRRWDFFFFSCELTLVLTEQVARC